eukprot:1809369-Pyramimonas_sp.AAC.1
MRRTIARGRLCRPRLRPKRATNVCPRLAYVPRGCSLGCSVVASCLIGCPAGGLVVYLVAVP